MMLMKRAGRLQDQIAPDEVCAESDVEQLRINRIVRFETQAKTGQVPPQAFFDAAYQAYQKGEAASGGPVDRFCLIGGLPIRLRFAGPALLPYILPSLAHLATGAVPNPTLTICLWDSSSTRTSPPPPPWLGYDAYTRRGEVRGYNNERISTAHNMGADVLNMLDRGLGVGLYWTRDPRRLPSYEISAPLRTVLHWWANRYGRQCVHGGAVGTANGGVLLAGKGGSGKSTTVLSCLTSDLAYLGDDYCLVATDPIPYAYSLYSSAKLNADNIHRVPHMRPALSNADRLDKEKALFFLHQHYPEKIVAGFPIRALLLPSVTGRPETTLVPASDRSALTALALSTMSQLPCAGQTTLEILNQLVKQVPRYHLQLGTDLARIPEVILGLLA